MRRRVVVTGLGCISPLGHTVEDTWTNIVDGVSGAGRISHYDPGDFKVRIAAEVKDFDPVSSFGVREARKMDRFTQFAVVAAREAVAGSSFRPVMAFITPSPPIEIGTIEASAPPESITSASPRRITATASPIALVPEAQAVTTARLGPRKPISMASVPPAVSGSIIGIRNGLIRFTPLSRMMSN